ncbi:hypothetical protein UCRPC4_g01080 [Phaeomoniella chlamydospora]|uniref:Uncharacterized protein n=1 Tax=Phaeomoniella chlamydospora TaxID=158046 RepID=A0A0G2HG95_PHACM|nr:hypothetical protein UCRPC4_g01080 [Phaeomoniella chlamydospora]
MDNLGAQSSASKRKGKGKMATFVWADRSALETIIDIRKLDLFGTTDTLQKVQVRLAHDPNVDDDTEPNQQVDHITAETPPTITGTPKPLTNRRKEKRAGKLEKSKAKALKNQERFDSGVTSQDVQAVKEAIHGKEDRVLATHNDDDVDVIIQRNIAFVAAVHASKKIYQAKGVETLTNKDKQAFTTDAMTRRVDDILEALDLSVVSSSTTPNIPQVAGQQSTPAKRGKIDGKSRKERQALVNKVRTLIFEDIEKCDADDTNTLIRMAGYYRYANKQILGKMLVNHEDWEWATGERVQQVDEDEPEDEGEGYEDAEVAEHAAEGDWVQEHVDDVWDDQADAALNAQFGGEDHPLVQLGYNRWILVPENEVAYQRVVLTYLEAFVLAVQEEDARMQDQTRANFIVNRLLRMFRDHEGLVLPRNVPSDAQVDPDDQVYFGNCLFDWIGASEDNVLEMAPYINPGVQESELVTQKITAAGEDSFEESKADVPGGSNVAIAEDNEDRTAQAVKNESKAELSDAAMAVRLRARVVSIPPSPEEGIEG